MESKTDISKKKLIVVVPAYNEQERITDTITGLKSISSGLLANNIELSVYVIDDGSGDNTATLATDAGCDRLLKHKKNIGLGAAIRTGFRAASQDQADIAIKFDADCQHDPNDIHALIEPILKDEAEVVYGNRFEKIEYKMPFIRSIGNRIFTALMRRLTHWPLKDSQPGILAVSRDYLGVFNLPGDYNYTQQILLDAYHKGMRFDHVPVSFRKRTTGKSFISLKYPFKVLPQLLMVLVSVKPLKIFAPMGFGFLFIALLLGGYEMLQWIRGVSEKPIMHVNLVMGFAFFGLHIFFFGLLAEIIVRFNDKK